MSTRAVSSRLISRDTRSNLLQLPWRERWDLAFLLDVLEHIPNHEDALHQIRNVLVPGGMLFVTVPALDIFWTWNDELAHHQRRYRRADFRRLAAECGLELVDARYFMFLLSPLLLASRVATSRRVRTLPREQSRQISAKMHKVPPRLANRVLSSDLRERDAPGTLRAVPVGDVAAGRAPEAA